MTIYRNRTYLEKSRFGEAFDLPAPEEGLDFIFVIPHTTFHFVRDSLRPFREKTPGVKAEFLLPLNFREKEGKAEQQRSDEILKAFVEQSDFPYPVHILKTFELPRKKALKNMAYKIGMDEALGRFQQVENKNGWIVSLDPGLAFPPNALQQLSEAILEKPKKEALGFGFRLPASLSHQEIFQRYLIEALRHAGHPHAEYSFGNTFAYKQTAYEKYGGIPQKKTGFTFSFIQKFIAEGSFRELPNLVIERHDLAPLPNFMEEEKLPSMKLFEEIGFFLAQLDEMFDGKEVELRPALKAFLDQEGFYLKLPDMRKHSNSPKTFQKRFYAWFGLSRIARFLVFGAEYHPPKAPPTTCQDLFDALGIRPDEQSCLEKLRAFAN